MRSRTLAPGRGRARAFGLSIASSFILEAGGFDSPLAYPSGTNYSAHCAASTTSLVRAATLEPPLAHAPLPH